MLICVDITPEVLHRVRNNWTIGVVKHCREHYFRYVTGIIFELRSYKSKLLRVVHET